MALLGGERPALRGRISNRSAQADVRRGAADLDLEGPGLDDPAHLGVEQLQVLGAEGEGRPSRVSPGRRATRCEPAQHLVVGRHAAQQVLQVQLNHLVADTGAACWSRRPLTRIGPPVFCRRGETCSLAYGTSCS